MHVLVSSLITEAALLMHKDRDVVLVLRAGLVPPEVVGLLARLLGPVEAAWPLVDEDGEAA